MKKKEKEKKRKKKKEQRFIGLQFWRLGNPKAWHKQGPHATMPESRNYLPWLASIQAGVYKRNKKHEKQPCYITIHSLGY
jgi:hypothetical protein